MSWSVAGYGQLSEMKNYVFDWKMNDCQHKKLICMWDEDLLEWKFCMWEIVEYNLEIWERERAWFFGKVGIVTPA